MNDLTDVLLEFKELVTQFREDNSAINQASGRILGRREALMEYVRLNWEGDTAQEFSSLLASTPADLYPSLKELQENLHNNESPQMRSST